MTRAEAGTRAEVLRAGPLTTVQDAGRPGLAHLGVPHSGAADLPALRRANLLVGNDPVAAALEATLLGPALRFAGPARVAVTGAPAPLTIDGRPAPFGVALEVAAGAVLDIGAATTGVRTYLAIAGGVDAEHVLGSRSRDTLTGLGAAPLSRGDVVRFGAATGGEPPRGVGTEPYGALPADVTADDATVARHAGAPGASDDDVPLRALPGPRDDRFAASALETLVTARFQITPTSNRIGVRLTGATLEGLTSGELPSEGLVRGAIQVPGSGEPIVMLADHPTTGGYPVIAVIAEADHARLGQLRPGTFVRFALAR